MEPHHRLQPLQPRRQRHQLAVHIGHLLRVTKMEHEVWWRCYDHGWAKGDIVEEAWSHPAKMAKGLVFRILREGLARGWFHRDDGLVIDPFMGIGSTGIACSSLGLRAIGCEVEPRFVELAKANRELHRREWEAMNLPVFEVFQGDSRNLAALVREHVAGCVTSPPYAEDVVHGRPSKMTQGIFKGRAAATGLGDYGTTPGQIGAMKAGAITSPPFREAQSGGGILKNGYEWKHPGGIPDSVKTRTYHEGNVGQTPGNIAALPMHAVTSPPYEGMMSDKRDPADKLAKAAARAGGHFQEQIGDPGHMGAYGGTYGSTAEGQVGVTSGESYWSAVRTIYEQLWELFSPNSHLAVVLKSYVKAGKLVDLPQMTLDLLVAIGFEPVTIIRAMLVAEYEQTSLLPEVPSKRKAKLSFFRRLYQAKHPENAIDFETVLVVKRRGFVP